MLEYWREFCIAIGAIATFFAGRKTAKIQNTGGEIDNLAKYQSMYDTFVKQYQEQYNALQKTVEALRNQVSELDLRNAIIIEEADTWKKRFNDLQSLYDTLKKEFENYKKKHK